MGALIRERKDILASKGIIPEITKAQKRQDHTEAERGRVLGQHQKGYLTEGELDLKMREIQERNEFHAHELVRMQRELEDAEELIEVLENFMESAADVASRLDTMDMDEKIEVIRLVVDRITIYKNEPATVTLAIGKEVLLSKTTFSPHITPSTATAR